MDGPLRRSRALSIASLLAPVAAGLAVGLSLLLASPGHAGDPARQGLAQDFAQAAGPVTWTHQPVPLPSPPRRRHHARPAPQPAPAAPAPAPGPVQAGTVPPASFTACVISRESGGDPTAYNSSSGASGLFGMLLSTWLSTGVGYPGGAYTAPASVQYRAFGILYARDGVSPWRPYDGC